MEYWPGEPPYDNKKDGSNESSRRAGFGGNPLGYALKNTVMNSRNRCLRVDNLTHNLNGMGLFDRTSRKHNPIVY